MYENKRRQDIVFLNILFCLLVIFIHISSEVVTKMDRSTTIFWSVSVLQKLSSFVVQGFILLSGVKLFLKGGEIKYGKFYLSRLTHVVIPYIIWVVIYYLYFCSEEYFTFSLSELGRFIMVGDISAHFYFVVVIAQFYLLAPLWVMLFKKSNPSVVLVVTLTINILCGLSLDAILAELFPTVSFAHLDLLFPRYIFYWAAGCVIGLHYQEFQNYLRRRWLSITTFFVICLLIRGWFAVRFIGGAPAWMDQIHILYCISAILFFYMVSQMFVQGGSWVLKPLVPIDKCSYAIYLIHCLLIFIANDYMDENGITDIAIRYGWRAVVAYGGSIILSILWFGLKTIYKNRKS